VSTSAGLFGLGIPDLPFPADQSVFEMDDYPAGSCDEEASVFNWNLDVVDVDFLDDDAFLSIPDSVETVAREEMQEEQVKSVKKVPCEEAKVKRRRVAKKVPCEEAKVKRRRVVKKVPCEEAKVKRRRFAKKVPFASSVSADVFKAVSQASAPNPKRRNHRSSKERDVFTVPKLTKEAIKRSAWNWKLNADLQYVVPKSSSVEKINQASELIQHLANAQADLYPLSAYVDFKGIYRAPVDVMLPIYIGGELTLLAYMVERNIFRTVASIIADFCHLLSQEQIRANWPSGKLASASRQSAHEALMLYTTKGDYEKNKAKSSSDVFPWCMRSIRSHDSWIDASNALMQDEFQQAKNPLSTLRRKDGVMKELRMNITVKEIKESVKNCRAFGTLDLRLTKNGVNPCTCN
jgi:hypothetical protein